jgi:hypothetical protein
MNILEIEDIIKGLPDQSLIQEAQAPSGQMPQFLVVSEIQRRADMRKRFQNQQQEMPQGTIADQIVQGGIASMGNRQPIQSMPPQGMPSQGMPPMPQQGMPQGMPQQGMPMQQQPPMSPPMPPPMSPPMMPPAQGMAAGGVVRMQGGLQTPYTGGTQIDPGYDEFMRQQTQNYLLNQGRIKESMPRPELNSLERFLQKAEEFSPGYSMIAPSVSTRQSTEQKGMDARGDNEPDGILQTLSSFFGDTGYRSSSTTPAVAELPTQVAPQTASSMMGGNASQTDTKRFGEGTRTANPETTAEAIETGMNTGSSEKTVQKDLSKDSDYSSLQAVIDEFKPVDYSAFKPDYLNLITEQERRAQKIRDDASKDASAQALIQLGAGLAAGDISKGLSAAGQSVADIKRQARAEARDEEGFARQLRLAQDEAGMQLGIKGAEAEREMARFKATYGVSLKELENTMTLAREQIAAEANTEAGRALRGELDALNNLIKNLMSEQYEGDIEQNKAAIAQAVSRMQFLLGITGEKQNEKKDTDVIETAKSVLGNQ